MLVQAVRNSDPMPSHIAEKEITLSGKRQDQITKVSNAVKQYVGHTSMELSKVTGMDRYMIARRLPDAEGINLVEKGEPRKCTVSNRMACTWYPVVNR